MASSSIDKTTLQYLSLQVIAKNIDKFLSAYQEANSLSTVGRKFPISSFPAHARAPVPKQKFEESSSDSTEFDVAIPEFGTDFFKEDCIHSPKCFSEKFVPNQSDLTNAGRRTNAIIPVELCNDLLKLICKNDKLDNATAFSLSSQKLFKFTRMYLKNCTKLTSIGIMQLLQKSDLLELNVENINGSSGDDKITLKEIMNCLSSWTKDHLTWLNISGMQVKEKRHNVSCSIYINGHRFRPICALHNLSRLNVSATDFTEVDLNVITLHLKQLRHLDISNTQIRGIACFLDPHSPKLKSLLMANMHRLNMPKDSLFNVLCRMDTLEVLDISLEAVHGMQMYDASQINDGIGMMLIGGYALPQLKFLDISGRQNIEERAFMNFFINHPCIEFLGLLQTELDMMKCFTDPKHQLHRSNVKVVGGQGEEQIQASLQCYYKRSSFCKASLFNLFVYTQSACVFSVTLVQLVIKIMRHHLHADHDLVTSVQVAGTACLYNLTNRTLGSKLPAHLLSQVADTILNTMEKFVSHEQMQKNCLLTLCSDRILKEVKFDYFRASKLVMASLCKHRHNSNMPRMAVAILSILAAKITTQETAVLGEHGNMKMLVGIAEEKMSESENGDVTLKFALSALWNLTDESPNSCREFVNCGGVALFNDVLQRNPHTPCLETKILGLLNNLAEVASLHKHLLKPGLGLLEAIFSKLLSKHIEVSYFAAGIISHLTSNKESLLEEYCQTTSNLSKEAILNSMYDAISQWKTPENEMVEYRTFKPFFALLGNDKHRAVQLWASWAINHVCSGNTRKYCEMLANEHALELITNVLNTQKTMDEKVWKLLKNIQTTICDTTHNCLPISMEWE